MRETKKCGAPLRAHEEKRGAIAIKLGWWQCRQRTLRESVSSIRKLETPKVSRRLPKGFAFPLIVYACYILNAGMGFPAGGRQVRESW